MYRLLVSPLQALNNCAVCLLYLGRLQEAISLLEGAINGDPAGALHEGLVLNLSTLYELASARSLHRKHSILTFVSQNRGDAFDVACLKMTS